MSGSYKLELALYDEFGRLVTRKVFGADPFEAGDLGLRGLEPPTPGFVTFDQAINVLKRRDLRKNWLEHAMRNLGRALGEHMEDKEGWHGAHRQALAEEADRR